MRYLLCILTAVFPVSFAMAQKPAATPAAPTGAVAQAETVIATNQTKAALSSFLLDAGVQYADEGEYREAEQAYLRALAVNPTSPDIRFRLATLYIQMEQYPKAAELLEKLSQEFPDNCSVQNNLSWIYAVGGKMKSGKLALRHAREAILIEPSTPNMWNTLAEAYYVLGQYKEAARSSELAIDLLKSQKGTEKEIDAFEAQRAKIKRAEEAYKRMLGKDDKE